MATSYIYKTFIAPGGDGNRQTSATVDIMLLFPKIRAVFFSFYTISSTESHSVPLIDHIGQRPWCSNYNATKLTTLLLLTI